jgi:hypothetical protein
MSPSAVDPFCFGCVILFTSSDLYPSISHSAAIAALDMTAPPYATHTANWQDTVTDMDSIHCCES